MRARSGTMETVRILPGREKSFWVDTTPRTGYPSLVPGTTVDVAVLGGGIVGVVAAFLLKEAGLSVAVIDMDRVLRKITGHTTAKLTAAQGIIYKNLIPAFGESEARKYAQANQDAIDFVEGLARARNIDCDFKRVAAYTFSESGRELDALKAEAEAAARLGLPSYFTADVPLPFPVKGAVCFSGQARFHPRKFLLALASAIPGGGSHIFEKTRVNGITEGEPCAVETDRGLLQARDVIIATGYPFVMEGKYFAKMYPLQSHVLGLEAEGAFPDDMFYSVSGGYSTIRAHPADGGQVILFGGEEHKTGQGGDIMERYRKMEEYARQRFRVRAVRYHWSTQDNQTLDGVPYIGRLTGTSKHQYVAAGFGGWGMTNGIVSAVLLSDMLLGKPDPRSSVFDSTRVKPLASVREFVAQGANVAREFVAGRGGVSGESVEDMANGEARVIGRGTDKTAVYKDEQGALHAVSAVCTHMGCIVSWDNAYRTWDCPCHGSRYTYDGKVIYGPAHRDLEPKDVSGK